MSPAALQEVPTIDQVPAPPSGLIEDVEALAPTLLDDRAYVK
jgi:hypothetical protein